MRSISMWLTILLLMFVVFLLPATAKGRRGFSAGTSLSITCSKVAYAYTGNPRQATLTVSVSGECNNKQGRITLTGSGVPAPGYVDMPPYSHNVIVTLPAEPGTYTYSASGKRFDGSDLNASITLYVVHVTGFSPPSAYVTSGKSKSFTVSITPAEAASYVTYTSDRPSIAYIDPQNANGTSLTVIGGSSSSLMATIKGVVAGEPCVIPQNASATVGTVSVTIGTGSIRVPLDNPLTINVNVNPANAASLITFAIIPDEPIPPTPIASITGSLPNLYIRGLLEAKRGKIVALLGTDNCGEQIITTNKRPILTITLPEDGYVSFPN